MPNNDGNIVKRTSQYIDNLGFDETTQLPMVELAGTDGLSTYRVKVTSDGSIATTSLNKLVTEKFDFIAATYPDGSTETYTYKLGGSGGTTVATVTVVYTDTTKENISTVART